MAQHERHITKQPNQKTAQALNSPKQNDPRTKQPKAQNGPSSKRPKLKTAVQNGPRHKATHGTKRLSQKAAHSPKISRCTDIKCILISYILVLFKHKIQFLIIYKHILYQHYHQTISRNP
jgi:ribosome assembly protein YihI (activator of Der GTPase)